MTNAIEYGFLDTELNFSYSRSGGPGGQHVNKVNTKVELRFNIATSTLLSIIQKEILLEKLEKEIVQNGDIIIIAQETRSQLKNKKKAVEKFYKLLNLALKPKKKRKATKVSVASKEKRLKEKKIISEKKANRKIDL
ncbi:MAG: aminoacyl-tRNA hydrolase [Bacteroidetes bacterium 4572_77]|nr:MAG: aminoacyl-tRNA hydrolase [Bacteroidetes bacterium 4572_77]